jgi:hypothetical protein
VLSESNASGPVDINARQSLSATITDLLVRGPSTSLTDSVRVNRGMHLVLQRAIIEDASGSGVSVDVGGVLRAEDVVIRRSAHDAIYTAFDMNGTVRLSVSRALLDHNQGNGVVIAPPSTTALSDIDIRTSSASGLVFLGVPKLTMERFSLSDNGLAGIELKPTHTTGILVSVDMGPAFIQEGEIDGNAIGLDLVIDGTALEKDLIGVRFRGNHVTAQ